MPEGAPPLGGVALLRAAKVLENLRVGGNELGVSIIVRAIEEPMRWIATNAGHEGSIVVRSASTASVRRSQGRAPTDTISISRPADLSAPAVASVKS